MTTSLAITPLSAGAIDEAAAVQARAFFDDPLFSFVFPDERERPERLAWLMRVGVTHGVHHGKVHTCAGARLGHAVWLPPGANTVSPEHLDAAGFRNPAEQMGELALARFSAFMEQVSPRHERLVPEPHWYLMILGVDPPAQGQGIGGALLQPILQRADAEGLRCYLETAQERNIRFYQKHGFAVAAETDLADGGPRIWMMTRRPPRETTA